MNEDKLRYIKQKTVKKLSVGCKIFVCKILLKTRNGGDGKT